MDFADQLRQKLRESFAVNFEPVVKDAKVDIDEGDVKLGGEEMRLANKETFIAAVKEMPDEEWSVWITQATTNRGLDALAKYAPPVDSFSPENGQAPNKGVGDLSGLIDEPAVQEAPEATPEGREELPDLNLEEGEFDINL